MKKFQCRSDVVCKALHYSFDLRVALLHPETSSQYIYIPMYVPVSEENIQDSLLLAGCLPHAFLGQEQGAGQKPRILSK